VDNDNPTKKIAKFTMMVDKLRVYDIIEVREVT